jgi:hypothetical protein
MTVLETPLAEELLETAHWSDDPPVAIEEQEFDLLAFELWHLGSYPDVGAFEDWADEQCTVADRASCL